MTRRPPLADATADQLRSAVAARRDELVDLVRQLVRVETLRGDEGAPVVSRHPV